MKRILTAFGCLLTAVVTNGQASLDGQHMSHKQFQSVVPQSPNAASLGKFGELPVGAYTGIPSINIPVYEINTGKLKLPVTLSYHAGGIKVEEIASWAGMGWSVSTGGQITRQVRGIADESTNGFLTQYRKIYTVNQMSDAQRKLLFDEVDAGTMDTEPDVFSFSAGNVSGEFFFDTTGAVITRPLSKVRVFGNTEFEITDNSGNVYQFYHKEITNASPLTDGTPSSSYSAAVSTWLLSRIINATGTDSIVFEYDNTVSVFTSFSSQTRYQLFNSSTACHGKTPVTYSSYNTVYGYRLKKIRFNHGEVVFNAGSGLRYDLPQDQALESIVIRSYNNQYYKKYVLHQHFVGSAGAPAEYHVGYQHYYRMFLDSISVYDNGNDALSKYKFEYDAPEQLPNRLSFDQDYWGYANGAANGSNLIPAIEWNPVPGQTPIIIPGANRSANASVSSKGLLKKLTYPTGGYTQFEYEGNKALTSQHFASSVDNNSAFAAWVLNGPTTFTSTSFTIPKCSNNDNTPVQIVLNNNNCGGGLQNLECPLVYLVGETFYYNVAITSSGWTTLPANQTYHIYADLSGVTDPGLMERFYAQVSWQNCQPQAVNGQTFYSSNVGGNRIKSITDYDQDGTAYNKRSYEYTLPGSTLPSGFLVAMPKFEGSIVEKHKDYPFGEGENIVYYYDCTYYTFSSASHYPLLATQGSTTGYSYVKEILGNDGANGKKEYHYISPHENSDVIIPGFPHPPGASFEWARGYPLTETVYKKASVAPDGYLPVSEKRTTYTTLDYFNQQGLKSGLRVFYLYNGLELGQYHPHDYTHYPLGGGLLAVAKDTVITYPTDNSSQTMMTANEYDYSLSNYSVNESKTKGGANKTLISKIKYPADYTIAVNNTNPVPAGIRNLTGHKLLHIPIESYTIQKDATGAEYVVSGTITQFYADRPLPEKIFILKMNAPIPINSFIVSTIDGSGNFIKDSRYSEEVLFSNYDAEANLKAQQKKNDVPLSYLYDYKSSLPIAQAVNAAQEDIAYTSFEADGKGGWTFSGTPAIEAAAPTGSKSYSFFFDAITRSINSSKTYIVSFWKNGTISLNTGSLYRTGRTINGWTYVEYEISNASVVSIMGATGKIDELRLYPKNAQMTTYTYEPLLGLTSQSDINGNISYYEYDTLSRLKFIKDTDKNVIKALQYKYQAGVSE